MSAQVPSTRASGRRRAVVAGLALLAAALVVLGLVLASGSRDGAGGTGTSAGGTATAEPTPAAPSTGGAPGTPPPPGPTGRADELPPSVAPVALGRDATVGDVTASVERLEAVEGTATVPGDVAGPAVRVTVRLVNGTADPLDLSDATVDVASGDERVPAPPLADPSEAPLTGTLEPGEDAEGVYVFRVPAEARDAVTVSVGSRPGAPYAVFTGAAA